MRGIFGSFKVPTSLYIKLEAGQTIKGDIEKIYLVCYPIFERKETSCKKIGWGHTTQNYLDRRFLMNEEDRASSLTSKSQSFLRVMIHITIIFNFPNIPAT